MVLLILLAPQVLLVLLLLLILLDLLVFLVLPDSPESPGSPGSLFFLLLLILLILLALLVLLILLVLLLFLILLVLLVLLVLPDSPRYPLISWFTLVLHLSNQSSLITPQYSIILFVFLYLLFPLLSAQWLIKKKMVGGGALILSPATFSSGMTNCTLSIGTNTALYVVNNRDTHF